MCYLVYDTAQDLNTLNPGEYMSLMTAFKAFQKIFMLISLTAMTLLGPASAFSAGGGKDGGGGNDLVASFTTRATALLEHFPFSDKHLLLLKESLGSSQIVSVPQLRNPRNHTLIENQQQLVAWGSLHFIQLKENRIQKADSWEAVVKKNRPFAHIIVHELFRASGKKDQNGRLLDDNFDISIGLYHLDSFVRVQSGPDDELKLRLGVELPELSKIQKYILYGQPVLIYTHDQYGNPFMDYAYHVPRKMGQTNQIVTNIKDCRGSEAEPNLRFMNGLLISSGAGYGYHTCFISAELAAKHGTTYYEIAEKLREDDTGYVVDCTVDNEKPHGTNWWEQDAEDYSIRRATIEDINGAYDTYLPRTYNRCD